MGYICEVLKSKNIDREIEKKYTDTRERNKSENKREKRAEHLRDRKFRKIFKLSKNKNKN